MDQLTMCNVRAITRGDKPTDSAAPLTYMEPFSMLFWFFFTTLNKTKALINRLYTGQ